MPRLDQLLEFTRTAGIIRSRDLAAHSFSRDDLMHAHRAGVLQRVARGLYMPADAQPGTTHTLTAVAKRLPHATVCLLSALEFHELTTQFPFEVWVAIDRKAWLPRVSDLPVRVMRFSGPALSEHVQVHRVGGVDVRIYSPAKTVADCFKYRNKIGLDVALEALRDCWRQRKATMDQIWHAAGICRVANIMRPYLESVT